jgi:hypothetical protein
MLADYGNLYRQVLLELAQSPPPGPVMKYDFLNDWITDVMQRNSHDR